MSATTKIEWTDATWNPVRGCTKVSPGCKHCYAETFAERWRGVAGHPYETGFDLRLVPQKLREPLSWKQPRMIFVNSMSDLFHEEVPELFIRQVFTVMAKASRHTFQVLTKRSKRLRELAPRLVWPDNVWMGVSVENSDYLKRISDLVEVPAAVRFLSIEPILGPIRNLPLEGISWVIVGGESGHGYRSPQEAWILSVRDQCLGVGVPFFFKQWGGRTSKAGGRVLEGEEWNQMPALWASDDRRERGV